MTLEIEGGRLVNFRATLVKEYKRDKEQDKAPKVNDLEAVPKVTDTVVGTSHEPNELLTRRGRGRPRKSTPVVLIPRRSSRDRLPSRA
jgi:hypothetical protein